MPKNNLASRAAFHDNLSVTSKDIEILMPMRFKKDDDDSSLWSFEGLSNHDSESILHHIEEIKGKYRDDIALEKLWKRNYIE